MAQINHAQDARTPSCNRPSQKAVCAQPPRQLEVAWPWPWPFRGESIEHLGVFGAIDDSIPCTSVFTELESKKRAPSATADQILEIMKNRSIPHLVGVISNLSWELVQKLAQVASRSGGQVPLHGRMFAQWLHFAPPRECPYPQVIDSNAAFTPLSGGIRWTCRRCHRGGGRSDRASPPLAVERGGGAVA